MGAADPARRRPVTEERQKFRSLSARPRNGTPEKIPPVFGLTAWCPRPSTVDPSLFPPIVREGNGQTRGFPALFWGHPGPFSGKTGGGGRVTGPQTQKGEKPPLTPKFSKASGGGENSIRFFKKGEIPDFFLPAPRIANLQTMG